MKSADTGALKKACEEAVKENAKAAADYKAGNAKSLFFLVGQVMKKTKGTADATEITKVLKELI
jgi:aspartyl-tRNA(Asn)/glutamyl-tRNA(Gln) amidotransferase subunit B